MASSSARVPACTWLMSLKTSSREPSGCEASAMKLFNCSQKTRPREPDKNSSRVTIRSPSSSARNMLCRAMYWLTQRSMRANSGPPSTACSPSRPMPASGAWSSAFCELRHIWMAVFPPASARPSIMRARYASGVWPASAWTPRSLIRWTSLVASGLSASQP
eukprot:scaffold127835_cov24-Tisochrysis_lutea.AAC.3